jgi:hypothetical protein
MGSLDKAFTEKASLFVGDISRCGDLNNFNLIVIPVEMAVE